MPLVSIIIPAYNATLYLNAALDSCLVQTHSNIEVIVVDDGSTDATRQVVEQYPTVKYIYQDNAGPGAARNKGIAAAKGDFTQFLDADDVLLPEKLSRSLAVFEAHPETTVVHSDFEWRTPDLSAPLNDATFHKTTDLLSPDENLDMLLKTSATLFATSCALCRTAPVQAVKGFDERLFIGEDWFLWVKLAASGHIFRPLAETLVWYRNTPGSLTSNELRMARQRLQAYQQLREISLPPRFDVDEMIAGRYHALAMKLWETGNRRETREHFRNAIQLHPRRRPIRRVLLWASYVLPATAAERMLALYAKYMRHE